MKVGATLFVCELAGGWLGVIGGPKLSSRAQAVALVVAAVVVAVVIGAWALVVEPQRNKTAFQQALATAGPEPTQTAEPKVLKLGVIGDSYSAEDIAAKTFWPKMLSRESGMSLANFAVGGTGYGSPKNGFLEQARQMVKAEPDIIVIAGSRNDERWPETVRGKAGEVYAYLAQQLPAAKIVVVGPMWDNREPSTGAQAANDAVREAAKVAGLPYTDALAENWLSDPSWIQDDNVHPNEAGQQALLGHFRGVLAPAVQASAS